MSVRPYQFEPLKKCSEHVEEDCGDNKKTSNTGKYNECYLETQLSLAEDESKFCERMEHMWILFSDVNNKGMFVLQKD